MEKEREEKRNGELEERPRSAGITRNLQAVPISKKQEGPIFLETQKAIFHNKETRGQRQAVETNTPPLPTHSAPSMLLVTQNKYFKYG